MADRAQYMSKFKDGNLQTAGAWTVASSMLAVLPPRALPVARPPAPPKISIAPSANASVLLRVDGAVHAACLYVPKGGEAVDTTAVDGRPLP